MTQTNAEEVYNQVVKLLPLPERVKLATIILNDISPQAIVDYSEEWSEEDLRDFSATSWAYIIRGGRGQAEIPRYSRIGADNPPSCV